MQFIWVSILILGTNLSANEPVSLSLENVINLAIMQSPSIKNAQNKNENFYWRWRNHKTRFRPQLTLSGTLPDYSRSTRAVTQEDGSIKFHQIQQGLMSAALSLNQSIPQTGANIYLASNVERVQDYKNNSIEFSGKPFYIGFWQPLFAYNWMKWSKKTEPLLYEESQKDFIETIEEISLSATLRFFRYLKVQTNFTLSENNLQNSQDNLKIAEAKKRLGKISENDFSRIKLSVFNARKSLNKARFDLKNADFELKSYIGLGQNEQIELVMPLNMRLFDVDVEKAIQESRENRKETPQFQRRLIEADRDLTKAKRSTGLNATLSGNFGFSNNSDNMPMVYQNPENSQQVKVGLSIPILDWGRSASTVKLAESKHELILYDVEKDREDFERRVVVLVEQFQLLDEQLSTAREADVVAENGYQIALRKFQNGEISITDLNISLQEREKARRDYIGSLESYWRAFYSLRILTLYDFELKEKIAYANPLLNDELTKRRLFK